MNVNQLLNDSLKYMQDGNIDLAETNLNRVLAKQPSNPDALSLLGIILIHKKKFNKGRNLIKLSLQIIPNQPHAILNLGLASYQENKFDDALIYFEDVIKINPDNSEAFYCKGLSFQKKGMLNEAVNAFNNAILKNPFYMDPIINLGYLYFDLKKFSLAISVFEKGLSLQSSNIELLNMIGNAQNELGLYSEAIVNLTKSLSIKKIQQDALISLAHAYMCQKDLCKSLALYNKALEINPDNVLALNNRANVYYLCDEDKKGINDLDRAIKLDKNFSNLYNTYGNILTKQKRFEEALEKYNLSLEISDSPEAYQNRAVLFYKKEMYKEALIDLNIAISKRPKYCDALNSRGVLYKDIGNFPKALIDFRRAIKISPLDSDGLSNIADLYSNLKKFDKAAIFYKKAIKSNLDSSSIDYSVIQARYNFSLHSLALKNFSIDTWNYYDNRKKMKHFLNTILGYSLELEKNHTLWNGESSGTLLIFGEQGLGDQIIAISLLNEALKKAEKIIFITSKKLIKLLQRSFENIIFLGYEEPFDPNSINNISFNFFIMSWGLGKLFRNNILDFKKQDVSYLKSYQHKTFLLKKNILGVINKKICGISWSSSAHHIGNYKSIKLIDLENIICLNKLSFVNLQYGDVDNEIKEFSENKGIEINLAEEIDKFDDIDGLTSLIDACDFVVTTSNVTAHIAGGLGKETYLLVPYSSGKIWYWHEYDDISIWYPSIKIFRQDKEGLWINAINNIAQSLKERLLND